MDVPGNVPKQTTETGRRLSPFRHLSTVWQTLFTLVLTFLGLTAVTFVIGRVVPIDPVLAIVGDRASNETYQQVFLEMGLDKPIWEQYLIYLGKVMHGDFGTSVLTSLDILTDILRYFPATLELATAGTIIGVLIGVPLGVMAAVRQGRLFDHVVRVVSLFGYSTPAFWLGMVCLLIFYAKLDLLPGPGRLDIYFDDIVDPVTHILILDAIIAREWEVLRNALSHLILPACILGYYSMAYIARMTRSFMLDQLRQEYVLTARVKGMSEFRVIWRHAFGNVLVQLITVIALSYATLLEGSVLTEIIFSWPGLGLYITNSLFNSDMNAVIGGTVVVGTCFIGLNMTADLLYRFVDPRAR